MGDNDFQITLEGFNEGQAPLAHLDSLTFIGNRGQASDMLADVISRPGFLTQGPALSNLTNGSQAGVVDQLIRHILDKPTAADVTYGIGTTKLFKLSSTTVTSGGSPSWPQAVTNMTSGESVIRLKTNLYGFYNKSSGGDILKMPLSTETIDPDWGSTVPTGAAALQSALHPVAAKEDVMAFGNGRYGGFYIEGSNTLDVDKLDFGEGTEVADVVFHANMWLWAVNSGSASRYQGQIYMNDASGLSTLLADEVGIGVQKIGWLYVLNGMVFVCYQDVTSSGFTIGFLNGRQIKPLRYFSGTLPDHRQKTLYKNTILFPSDGKVYSVGAVVEQLPYQISKLADGGHGTIGGIAAPFGTPYVASTDGGSNHRVAKFSGYALDSYWKSVLIDVANGRQLGKINTVIVATKALGANAKCVLTIEGNQGTEEAAALDIETTGKTRHVFNSVGLAPVEDIRVALDWAEGNATNDCPIRKITLLGNYVER